MGPQKIFSYSNYINAMIGLEQVKWRGTVHLCDFMNIVMSSVIVMSPNSYDIIT